MPNRVHCDLLLEGSIFVSTGCKVLHRSVEPEETITLTHGSLRRVHGLRSSRMSGTGGLYTNTQLTFISSTGLSECRSHIPIRPLIKGRGALERGYIAIGRAIHICLESPREFDIGSGSMTFLSNWTESDYAGHTMKKCQSPQGHCQLRNRPSSLRNSGQAGSASRIK